MGRQGKYLICLGPTKRADAELVRGVSAQVVCDAMIDLEPKRRAFSPRLARPKKVDSGLPRLIRVARIEVALAGAGLDNRDLAKLWFPQLLHDVPADLQCSGARLVPVRAELGEFGRHRVLFRGVDI
jgi:hypothetical protein